MQELQERGIGDNSGDYGDADTNLLDEMPTDWNLSRVRDLAKLQVQREAEVDLAKRDLKIAEANLSEVADFELPKLLLELGMKKIPLVNGATVALKTKTVAYVKVEDQQAFYAWLNENGFGSLVKRKVTTEFPRGYGQEADALLSYLGEHFSKQVVTDAESIHPGTLNAWAREMTEKNLDAMRVGGKVVDLPPMIKVTELKESAIVLPKSASHVDWS